MIQSVLYGKPSDTRVLLKNSPAAFPGIYFVLFTRTMAVLFRRSIPRAEMHRVMIATAIVMWIIATGVCNPRLSYTARSVVDPRCHA